MRICLLFALVAGIAAVASPPLYQNGVFVQAGGTDIDVGYYGSPCVVDWNGDGLKDLIMGIFSYGNIYVYLNSGTNAAPVFTTYTVLAADGVTISLPYG